VHAACVGFATLPEPLRGSWPLLELDGSLFFPPVVQLLGRTFKRSDTWAAPQPHILKQYREDVDRGSMHLYVQDDRTWKIDHIDEANPERGLVLEHTFRDVIQTTWGALLLTAGVVAISAGVAYVLTRGPAREYARLP
jgi:hypothetical protein